MKHLSVMFIKPNTRSKCAVLVTTYYPESNKARVAEYRLALHNNINNDDIDKIYIISESGARLCGHPKVEYIDVSGRPTFRDACDHAAAKMKGRVAIICNGDIFFDASLRCALNQIKSNECYALTRWEKAVDGALYYVMQDHSQDAWIFSKVPEGRDIGRYYFGRWGCDNRFAAELSENGYKVKNPSLNVRAVHCHATGHRTYKEWRYDDSIQGSMKYVCPTALMYPGCSNINMKIVVKAIWYQCLYLWRRIVLPNTRWLWNVIIARS